MTEAPPPRNPRGGPRRRRLWAGAIALGALVVVGEAAAWAILRYPGILDDARGLRSSAAAAVDELRDAGPGLDERSLASVRTRLAGAAERHRRLVDALDHDPLFALGRLVPPAGAQLDAADALVDATGELLASAEPVLRVADRYVAIRAEPSGPGEGSTSLSRLVALMGESRADVDAAAAHLAAAAALLDDVPDDALAPIRTARDEIAGRVADIAPLLDEVAVADDTLPAILGTEGRRRYLVLAQDPAELRPTGGFIGTYGIVEFDEGRLVEKSFRDVYTLDLKPGLPYVEPPPELERHLLGRFSWQLADANWSPDFPTSAKSALDLYRLESGDAAIDGVIGLTTYAIDDLLEVLGPVDVPEWETTVAAGETTLRSLAATRHAAAPGQDRKAFLDAFAGRVLDRLFELPPERWADLLPAFEAMRDGRHAAVWLVDEDEQRLVSRARVDGSVLSTDGDYLFPVEANVAPVSKLSLVTSRRMELAVELDEVGNAAHTLDVRWDNTIESGQGPAHDLLREYQARRVMGLYYRLLVPERSRIVEVAGSGPAGATAPESVDELAGRSSFGVYQLVPPGESAVRFRWVSPYPVRDDGDVRRYVLTIQKQPGVEDAPISVVVRLPDGASFVEPGPLRVASAGGTLEGAMSTVLEGDLRIEIAYRDRGQPG